MTTGAEPHERDSFAALALGAVGVVFGDIGTSPLYAFREALGQVDPSTIGPEAILGVLSLALWALILIVTTKYVLFLMRADNEGEGGVLVLMSLAQKAVKGRSLVIFALGAAGAALFYGDGIITPALSVLAAVEGLRSVPALHSIVTDQVIIAVTALILIALFGVQSRGTASVAKLFGPICLVWFLTLGALGILHIADEPAIFQALIPYHGVAFLLSHGTTGLFVLGAVFLTVTGAEALIADMGHFGRLPIQTGWFALVFPCLALNYLGQGAFALATLEQVRAAGAAFTNLDWFFLMAPQSLRVPLVIMATLATIIASQAVITGAFSITQQAIQLGLLPRLKIRQTSARAAGQIYLPVINALLFVGVIILVFSFRSSSAMAAAYGIAVTGTMVITTSLAFIVVWKLWKWRLPLALAVIVPFLIIDLVFFGANILRVVEGGWVPLLVAGMVGMVIATWARGRRLLDEYTHDHSVDMDEFARVIERRPPQRVPGTAVYMTTSPDRTPTALLHNMKHNKVLHEHNLLVKIVTAPVPLVPPGERCMTTRLNAYFEQVTLTYGFMEQPDVARDLDIAAPSREAPSFILGRHTWVATRRSGMPFWQDKLFSFMMRNATDPTDFFRVPPNRTVQIGEQVAI